MAREWDAGAYDRISESMEILGRAVIDRMRLAGDEAVLDAGCGSGRVTARLVERVPRGRVIGIDSSPAMIELARRRLGDDAELRVGDILALDLDAPVDAVLCTATLHWIDDHARAFARFFDALAPGGALHAQCGAHGNVERFRSAAAQVGRAEPYAAHLAGWPGPWTFPRAEETRDLLTRAGFVEVSCWVEATPYRPENPRAYVEYMVIGPYLERLPEALRRPFADGVIDAVDDPAVIDYVRLNIEGRRP